MHLLAILKLVTSVSKTTATTIKIKCCNCKLFFYFVLLFSTLIFRAYPENKNITQNKVFSHETSSAKTK